MNAAFAQVTQALFIVVDILLEVSGLGLDMFVYGYTFYYRPAQTDGFNHFFPFLDFLYCPYFPVWNMMQGVYNAGSPGLMSQRLTGSLGPYQRQVCSQRIMLFIV